DPVPSAPSITMSPSDMDEVMLPIQTRELSFAKLTNQSALKLRTRAGAAGVNFSTRRDEIVTSASIKLRYMYSPALIPAQSHIRVVLNGETLTVLPVTREQAGLPITRDIPVDPRFVTGFNQLVFEFVGHYTNECEDPLHTSIWADISGASELRLQVKSIPVKDDLSLLPRPF